MMTAADALVILLVVLTVVAGIGPAGWLAGLGFCVVGWAALTEGLHGSTLGAAERLTLARAVLVGGVTALVAEATDPRPDPLWVLWTVAALALALRFADRLVARPSPFGARFAMEVDAFFVLVLSAAAATSLGAWVVAIGLLRYVFVAAGWLAPWLRAPLPPDRTRSAIALAQSFVLLLAVTRLLPTPISTTLVALSLATLTLSFAMDVRWLHAHRADAAEQATPTSDSARRRVRTWVVSVLAVVLVLFALVGPNQLGQLGVAAYARIPVEGVIGLALLMVLPRRTRRVTAIVAGVGLGLLTIVKFIDMGFYEVFDRPFHPVFDWSFFGPALEFVQTSAGNAGAVLAVIGVVLLVLALLVLMTLAVLRLTRLAVGHRTVATRGVAMLGVVWLVCGVVGVRFAPDEPLAARSAADHLYDNVRQVRQGLLDGEQFAAKAAVDDYRYTPGAKLLTSLRGKDVLFVFVESYGRVAIENSDTAPVIDPLLDEGTDRLRAAGFDSRSAFLTSPVYGGGSAFAHATMRTGLWIDNMQRYLKVVTLDRTTLSVAFNRAGWRTVGNVPANTRDWPDGDVYHYDKVYDSRNVGYQGPRFSYATVPDQYTLHQFERDERAAHDEPVMAEIDLISSHTPFTPVPHFIDWDDVGDGSVYDPMPAEGPQPSEVWPDPTKVRAAYTASIEYSLTTLLSYIETYGDDDMVVVFMGDHQPQPIISSQDDTRDVPISIVARDPAVLDQIDSWRWSEGLNPAPDAPEWPMDTFRDRFLSAYGPQGSAQAAKPR
jgi:hypothetical protein